MNENRKVTRAAGIIGGATLASRLLGFVRDMVVAAFLGAGIYADAFITAFRLPNLFRRLFAEGSLSIAFVPIFSEYLYKDGPLEANRLAQAAFRWVLLFSIGLTLAGIILAPAIVWCLAFGFVDMPAQYKLTILLTRIMLPYIVCIGFVALSMGVLNAFGHFTAPALAPVFLNTGMILTALVVSFYFPDQQTRAIGLAVGVVIGGMLQLWLQVPFLLKYGIIFKLNGPFLHPGLARAGRLLAPAVFGAGVYQINVVIGTFLATGLQEGSVSYLYYADRLIQFPLGIFAISMGTALLPSLSREYVAGNIPAVKKIFVEAFNLVLFILLPSAVGLVVLGHPIITLLFGRGAFGSEAIENTALAVMGYSAGLWAIAAVRMLIPVFYAMQDVMAPVKIGLVAIGMNVACGWLLMHPLGHLGVALAASIASICNFVLLSGAFRLKVGPFGGSIIMRSFSRSVFCSLLMGIAIWKLSIWLELKDQTGTILLGAHVAICILAGILLYALFSFMINSYELQQLLNLLRRNRKIP